MYTVHGHVILMPLVKSAVGDLRKTAYAPRRKSKTKRGNAEVYYDIA